MNNVILIGRLTKEPELRYTGNSTPVASFTIAVDRDYKNENGEREADFINVVTWRKVAENCSKYIGKGSLIAVFGKISTRKYQTQKGDTRYITEVVAEKVVFLNSKKQNDAPNEDLESADVPNDPFEEMGEIVQKDIPDEDLPF